MAQTNERAAQARGATPAQLGEAERGLKVVLAPTFSAAWIAQNYRDLLSEASAEYAEWLGEHRPAPNPPGWLVQRARWRALDLVARENRRSGPPLDSVIYSAEDPAPTPEETSLERDRHRRIADALSHIPEMDRKLLALVYYEGHSIIGAGRLLGWGKSRADRHHAAALERLRALVGPRDLLSPALVGLVAQATALADRGRLVGGAVNRYSARAQDLADAVTRTFCSLRRSAEDAARRAAPFADTGTAPIPGGAGRVIAQCGALAAAAICSAVLLSPVEHGVEAVFPHGSSNSPGRGRPRRPSVRSNPPASTSSGSPQIAAPEIRERPPLTARTAARSKRRRRHAARRAKLAQARRARKRRAKAKASAANRNSPIEAPEELNPEPAPEEVAPEAEAVTPETETAPAAPSPATGAQTREQFGL